MTIAANNWRHGRVRVGFAVVPLCIHDFRLYDGLTLRAHQDNTASIYVTNRPQLATHGPLQGLELPPGWSIDLPIDAPTLWGISEDAFQILDWWGC